MRYISTYESFKVNETMDMFTMPVDPIPGMKDVMSDIGQWISETGEIIWNKLNQFVEWISEKLKGFKEYFSQLFQALGEMSKIQFNRITNLLFSKDYSDVSWSDMSIESVKKLYTKISDGIKDKSWSFSDDEEKLKSEEGLKDKSLKMKYAINKILSLGSSAIISTIIGTIITKVLIALGMTAGPLVMVISSIVVIILFIWASKKKVNLEVKVMKDVRDVPGYKEKSLIGRITGFSKFGEEKIKELEDFTQGESPFQKMYYQKLKELSEKIKKEELSFN